MTKIYTLEYYSLDTDSYEIAGIFSTKELAELNQQKSKRVLLNSNIQEHELNKNYCLGDNNED